MLIIGTLAEKQLTTSIRSISNTTELIASIVRDSASQDVLDSIDNSPITMGVIKSSIQSRIIKNLDQGVTK